MYVLSQRHPVWVTENHVNPCNSVYFAINPHTINKHGAHRQMYILYHADSDLLGKQQSDRHLTDKQHDIRHLLYSRHAA